MVTKAKKALLASLAAFLCVMLTVFGLSMSVSLSETAKAADETSAVAQVGTTKYETLAKAIAAAKDGETVKLLADATEDVVVDKNITLDLGGKTLTGAKTSGKASLTVVKGATATVKNGTILGTENSYYTIQNNGTATFESLTATAGNTDSSMIDNWGTLTINSGEYSGGLNVVKSEEGSVLTINGGEFTRTSAPRFGITGTILVYGTTTITGGKFIDNTSSTNARVVVTGVVEGYTAITRITGGSFTNTKGAIFHYLGDATYDNFEVSGGTFNKSIPEGYCANGFIPTKQADGTYGVKEGKYVAKIGSKKYETLADAIRLAAKGKTVTLLDNIILTEQLVIGKNLTIDLGGFTLTSNYSLVGSGADRYAIVLNAAVTIKNGKIVADNARVIGAYGAMTMDGVTVENGIQGGHATIGLSGARSEYVIRNSTINGAYSVSIFANNATVTITDSKLIGRGNTLYHNGSNYGLKLTVTGTEISSSASCGVYISGSTEAQSNTANQNGAGGYQQATFTRCTISGTNGIEVKYTNLTLNSCSVSTTENTPSYKQENNGPAASGFAVVSTDNAMGGTTPAPKGTIAVSGEGNYVGAIGIGTLIKNTYEGFEDASYAVSGGKFNHAILPEYCAEGFIPTENADGTYGVKEGTYVAEVNGVKYETLQAAFDAAKTGDIVKLLTDITLTAQVNITKALNGLTLDGNGKTITCATTTDVFTSGGSALYFGNATDKLYCTGIKIKDLTMTGKARFAIFLCGGTTTEFTNVNISGEYYIAVNLYGTHGATMTNCTISNSTIGTDEYISGVWSNVASANPLRLVNTAVDVIAINAYTTANTLAPKIFIDKNSSAEVHTFDDGSVSYNKKLCVSTESEGSYTVKEYFNSEWVDTYVAEVKGVKYETLQEAFDAAERNATVTLLANTKENVTITQMYITLDLNGYTINGGKETRKPAVTVKAKVTIKDSSAAQTGKIMREDTAENSGVSSHYVIDVQDGWLTFEGGKVINNSGNDAGKGASLVRVGDDSVAKYPGLNIKGGTFTQDNFIVIKVDCGDLFLNGGTLNSANSYAIENWHRATVKGGTVNGDVAAWTYSGGLNSTLEISGGTINGNVESVTYDGAAGKLAKVSITGGTVTGTLSNKVYSKPGDADKAMATIEVTGGTFDIDPSKYVTEAAVMTENEDGTFGVAKTPLATVGDKSYYTMEEAFKAQTASGEAIVMLRNYTTGSTFNSGTKHRVVDLNGHTWTCTSTDMNSAAFEINYADVTLTVKNGKIISNTLVGLIPSVSAKNGTITYDNAGLVFDGVAMTSNGGSGIETNGNNTNDSVTLINSTLNVPNGFGIYFPSSGTLTIDKSTIIAKTMGVQVCSGELVISGDSEITVTGDAVPKTENDGAIQDGAAISIVNRPGYKGLSNIVITGGTFTAKAGNDAIKAYDWVNKVESTFTKADLVAVSGGTFTNAVPAEYCAEGFIPTKNADGTYGVKVGTYVAKIGEAGYETLAEAIAAAKDGETVKLLADIDGNLVIEAGKDFTLDLNGFTLNGGTGNKNAAILNHGTLTITDSSAAKTGTIKRDDNGDRGYYVILNLGTMTIEQANVVNNSGHDGSSLIRNGGNDTKVSTLTINGGEFTQNDFIAIKNDSTAVLNINGGIISSENESAVQNWSTAHILGGTLNGILWTLTYDETTIGKTVFGGEAVLNGRIYTEKYSQNVTVEPYVSITGGKLNVTKYKVENSEYLKVSGGTFSSDVEKDYLADRFVVNKNTDGTYGVTAGNGFAGANVVVTEGLAMKVTIANGTASKYVVVTYKGLDGVDKSVKLDTLTDGYYLFDQIMPQMIDVKFSFELYGENNVMLDRKANYSVVDYLAHIIKSDKDSAAFRNVAASLIEYANRAKAVKGLTKIAPTFVKGDEIVDLDALYTKFVDAHKIPAKDTVGAISKGDGQVIYKARVVFDDAYTLTFYTNDNEKQYTYKLDDKDIVFDENGEYTVNVLAQNITTKYVLTVYDKDSKLVQTVTYGVSTYCIRMQETKTPQGELYVASYYYGVAVNQYGTANPNSVQE